MRVKKYSAHFVRGRLSAPRKKTDMKGRFTVKEKQRMTAVKLAILAA